MTCHHHPPGHWGLLARLVYALGFNGAQRVTVSDIKWRRTTVLVSDIEGSYHYFCLWIAITPGVSLKNSACLDSKNERDMRSCCLEKVPASNCGLGDATTCAKFPILELDRGTKLVNLGDNCDQGPGCIRVQLSFLRAVSDYRDRVLLVLGNRDTHHLKIMSEAGSWRELSEFYQQRGAYGLGVPQGEGANIETVVKWSLTLSNQLGGQYALPSEAWESRRQELGILLGEDDGHEITDAATAASFVILVAPDKADTKPDERSDYMHASCSSSAPPAGGVTSDGVHPAAGAGPGSGRSWALRLEHVDVVGGDVEKGGREVRFGDLRENECKLLQGLQGIAFRLCESGKLADVDVDDAGALYTHAGPFGSPSASPPVEAYRSVHMQKLAEATGDDLISVIGYVPPALDYMPFWTQSPDERLATFKANMEDRLTGHQAKQERGVGSLKKWVADLDSWKAEQLRAYRQCPFFYSSSNTDSATNQGGTPGVENEGHARGRCVAPKMFQSTGETSDTTFVPQGGASTGAVVSLMRGRVEQGPKGLRGWTGEVAEQDRWFYQRGGIDLMLLCTPVTRYPTPCYQNHESTTKRERWVAPACRVAAETDGQVTIFARGHTPIGVAPVLLTETCTTEDMKSKQYSVVHMEIDTSYSGMMLTGDTMPTTSGHRAATASRSLFDPEERLHQDRTDKRGVGMGATVMILPLFSQDSARKGGAQLEPEDRIWVHGFAWLPRRVNPKDVHLVDWVWRESSTDESEGPSYFQVFQYGYHGSINRCPESTSTRSSQHSANGCFTSGASTVLQELSKGTQSTAAIVIPGEAIWTGMPSSLLLTLCGELFAPERASSGEVESEASQSQTPASLRGENALDRCGGPLWQEKQDDTHAATLSGDSLGAVVRRSSGGRRGSLSLEYLLQTADDCVSTGWRGNRDKHRGEVIFERGTGFGTKNTKTACVSSVRF
ncbi:unnamed protein product [Amoebophrya sp. A25]|nr:unnamed protein product [Amoebophrya sp. A25]|eukprot:GSA25T00027180001.1